MTRIWTTEAKIIFGLIILIVFAGGILITIDRCTACNGEGKWSAWMVSWPCQLCKGRGTVFIVPWKTYCPKCHGRWNDGIINCDNCNETGLVSRMQSK